MALFQQNFINKHSVCFPAPGSLGVAWPKGPSPRWLPGDTGTRDSSHLRGALLAQEASNPGRPLPTWTAQPSTSSSTFLISSMLFPGVRDSKARVKSRGSQTSPGTWPAMRRGARHLCSAHTAVVPLPEGHFGVYSPSCYLIF